MTVIAESQNAEHIVIDEVWGTVIGITRYRPRWTVGYVIPPGAGRRR